MADLSALRQRVIDRGEQLVETAGAIIEQEMRDAAGPGLTPDALERDAVTFDEPIVSTTLRSDVTITTWVWVHNHQPPNDFPPHVALDGTTFDENDWRDVLAKDPGDVPFGDAFYYPQQIEGCQCEVDIVSGDLVFDAQGLDASPQVISAFGQQILVTPAAPERSDEAPAWFSEVATQEAWTEALQQAQGE